MISTPRDGALLLPNFIPHAAAARAAADFELLFERPPTPEPVTEAKPPQRSAFGTDQFRHLQAVPLDCSPALNLIGVHPLVITLARRALGTERVHLYQCQAWAKFTGATDYAQPFHCDFGNHTLTVPSEDFALNSITCVLYLSDVSEAHGPMHYVTKTDSALVARPEETLSGGSALQEKLQPLARSTASPAGSVFAYGIDVYHRATSLTAPGGHRYVVTACYKVSSNDSIGYHAWPFHNRQPWANIFNHASPDQLSCFGVPPPGDRFWTPRTLAGAQLRYPAWDLQPYRNAMTDGTASRT